MEPTHDIPLHDIKTIVDVEEYSLYYLSGAIGVAVLLFLGLLYIGFLWYKRRTAFNLRREYIKQMSELDLSDAKGSAYAITEMGLLFRDDSPRHESMYKNLTERLNNYKYKKSVDGLDSETLGYIELYREMLDV
jgi:hypothetical protein